MMRIGIAGGGYIARVHAAAYARIADAEVVAVAERDADARGSWPGVPTHESLEDLLAAGGLDVLDVCLPTPLHRSAVEAGIRAGLKQLICEKPLARTVADARAIVEAVEAAGATLYVGQVVRFWPSFVAIRDAIVRGDIGAPAVARSSRVGPPSSSRWFNDAAQSGGVILDMLVHDFDFLRWCLGEVERVYAKAVDHRYALVTLRFRSGAIGHVEGSWLSGRFRTTIEVAGDRGMVSHDSLVGDPLRWDLLPGEQTAAAAWSAFPEVAGPESPQVRELMHFVECARTGKAPLITGRDALAAVAIACAAEESARTGLPVELGKG